MKAAARAQGYMVVLLLVMIFETDGVGKFRWIASSGRCPIGVLV